MASGWVFGEQVKLVGGRCVQVVVSTCLTRLWHVPCTLTHFLSVSTAQWTLNDLYLQQKNLSGHFDDTNKQLITFHEFLKFTQENDESRPGRWLTSRRNSTGYVIRQEFHRYCILCYLSERRCDDTTFVLINTSVTITNRHETCCRLQERILNTPLLSVIWLKQHTSPDFINTLLFHSSEHIRLIWLFYYRSHWF